VNVYKSPLFLEEILMDEQTDPERWIDEQLTEKFQVFLAGWFDAHLIGDGTGEPLGILNPVVDVMPTPWTCRCGVWRQW